MLIVKRAGRSLAGGYLPGSAPGEGDALLLAVRTRGAVARAFGADPSADADPAAPPR